ncbi:short-chain fatty acid transporter [Zeaxanthinibacter enoshimensis]|uniref:Short-chain fatty acids transporter n=1 Tax=Zeaxanthinibacter enoshimensis TaxID=392009 RepID=A0A4V3D473_9FLAO|nr:TIGR00366 family protein [Zeaxanthinibacter enoshimensis]TDQ33191.1 short-chain fatty acids transporter [Zeaxanthinibacter enoshimensis]
MKLTRAIETVFRRYLPSPFTIAVLLTLFTILLAWIATDAPGSGSHLGSVLSHWESGIWNTGLLVFAYQMMLILVLGHVLVLSRPVEKLIQKITGLVSNPANAALLVALPTMLVSFFNWGLGLIFGALLARKVGEYAQEAGIPVNYPLVGACGYLGLMVWHGGISGSAPIKASEEGHITELLQLSGNEELLSALPGSIPTSFTVFSTSNLLIFVAVLIAISGIAYYLGRNTNSTPTSLPALTMEKEKETEAIGSEKLDRSPWLSAVFGLLILGVFCLQYTSFLLALNITPDMLNFFMLGLALLLHGSLANFGRAVEAAIGDTAGILIQFPLYFGIMGIMAGTGMIGDISDFFASVANSTTLPILTFFSAGLVNVFVPSGGGQWAVQGPLVIESALQLGVPLPKALMALAYGDQVTNMLQPFWALPLLAITKLKASEILPYTLMFMLVGSVIYLTGLLLF